MAVLRRSWLTTKISRLPRTIFHVSAAVRQLGASRLTSFECRMRFVFPVVHWFPLVVPQYFIRVRLIRQPLPEPDVRS